MPDLNAEPPKEDPPVIKTKLNFKRAASQTSSSSKRRKTSSENAPRSATANGTTNGASPKPKRQPDFDFTNDDEIPLPKVSKIFWPDRFTFKDALFSALSDVDDAAHWAQVFGTEIHIYPRPRPTMNDEEYATWVREQVYGHVLRESHQKKAREAQEERMRQEAKRRQQKEEREQRYYEEKHKRDQAWQKMYQERLFGERTGESSGDSSSARNLRSQAPLQRWKDYLAAFQPPPPDANLDLLLLWQQSDVPWPTPSGLEKDISEANIRSFIKTYAMKYSEHAAGDWKKAVKQNQYYWHPDKFRQIQARKLEKLTSEKKEEIMQRVTEVSQILNKLAQE